MVQTWKITDKKPEKINFQDTSTLDAISRQLPDGYYSTFRTYGSCTRVIGLSAHLRRLPNLNASSLRRQLFLQLEQFRPPFGPRARRGETADEARVRVTQTFEGQVYLSIEPLKRLPQEVYDNGVHVETVSIQRDAPRVKSTTFIGQSDAERKHIAQAGTFEALLVKNGRVLEGMTSNFFYILRAQREVLWTAQRDILLGVTRRTVIHVARGRGLEVKYKSLKLDQLSALEEAFITSSSRGVVPVVQIDNEIVGRGMPGQVTRKLIPAYDEYVLRHAEKINQGI